MRAKPSTHAAGPEKTCFFKVLPRFGAAVRRVRRRDLNKLAKIRLNSKMKLLDPGRTNAQIR
jgi:hypothetical protein